VPLGIENVAQCRSSPFVPGFHAVLSLRLISLSFRVNLSIPSLGVVCSVSKHGKEKTQAPLADWEVVIDRLGGSEDMPAVHVVPASRHWREKSGWHVFTDDEGLAAEFAPGAVLSVTRLMRGAAKDEAGPEILPVTPHGGK
jgi:hypothetical protein